MLIKTRSDDTDSEISGGGDDDDGDEDSSRFLSTDVIDVAASPVPSSQGAAETHTNDESETVGCYFTKA